jgi:hypothetical protein
MSEPQQRILEILTKMKGSDSDEVLCLHEQLPKKLSHAIMCYGLGAATEAIRNNPSLLDHVGPMS